MDNRKFKGNSIIAFPSDYVIVDIETTGLSSEWDSIIEITALRARNGEVIDRFSSLVHEHGAFVDGFIEGLTGITQGMIDSAPAIETVLPAFLEFVGTDIIVGQNISFDVNFLYDRIAIVCDEFFKNDHIDIARFSRKIFAEEKHHRLSDIAERYGIDYTGSHRSERDCVITGAAFELLKRDAVEKFGSTAEFKNLFNRHRENRQKLKASEICSYLVEFDEDHPLFEKKCVFTGTLEKMVRKEAMQLVVDYGGLVADRVTKDTNYLILGNLDYCSSIKGTKSSKQKKAEQYKKDGLDIEIIPEDVFYDMILTNDEEDDAGFDVSFYKQRINNMLENVICEKHLPKGCLQYNEQYDNKNPGEFLLQIFEADWPVTPNSTKEQGVLSGILAIKEVRSGKYEGCLMLTMKQLAFDTIPLPSSVVSVTKNQDGKNVRFKQDDPNLISYIREHVLFKLDRYRGSHTFACCSRFEECSDALHCVHDNLLYASGCQYKRNLDAGHVFYGKNRNI